MEYFVIHLGLRLALYAGLAFAFVLSGILFDENRLVGHGVMGIGMIPPMWYPQQIEIRIAQGEVR